MNIKIVSITLFIFTFLLLIESQGNSHGFLYIPLISLNKKWKLFSPAEVSERERIRQRVMAQRKAQTKNRTIKVRTYWQKQFNTFQDHMEEKLDTKCTKTAMAAKGILFGLGLAPARKPERVFEVASPNGKI